jgi:hypothetical protein
MHRGSLDKGVQTCILIRGLESVNLPQFGMKDNTAARVEFTVKGRKSNLAVVSSYLPITNDIPSPEMERLAEYFEQQGLLLIIGCDTNAHHFAWGSHECNSRGNLLAEYIATTTLEIANKGCEPNFVSRNRQTVIDLTLVSRSLANSIDGWQVSQYDSLSDHRQITFHVKHDKPACWYRRNPKATNWSVYDQELQKRLGLRIGRVKTPEDI